MFYCENRASSCGAVVGFTPPLTPLWQCIQLGMFVIQRHAGLISSYALFCRESNVEKQGGKIP